MLYYYVDAAVEAGGKRERNPKVSTSLKLIVENEQADAGRDVRTCPARPNYQARMNGE